MELIEDNLGLLLAALALAMIAVPLALFRMDLRGNAAPAQPGPAEPASTPAPAEASTPVPATAEPPPGSLSALRKRLTEVRADTRQAEQRERRARGRVAAAERRLEEIELEDGDPSQSVAGGAEPA